MNISNARAQNQPVDKIKRDLVASAEVVDTEAPADLRGELDVIDKALRAAQEGMQAAIDTAFQVDSAEARRQYQANLITLDAYRELLAALAQRKQTESPPAGSAIPWAQLQQQAHAAAVSAVRRVYSSALERARCDHQGEM